MLAAIAFIIAVVLCAANLFWDATIRVEWPLGLVALGLALSAIPFGPAWPRRTPE